MTDHLTASVIALGVIMAIAYDIWTVWRGGSKTTLSWTALVWWLLHPTIMVSVFILVGHLWFPACAKDLSQTELIKPLLGTVIGLVAIALICYEVFIRWTQDERTLPPFASTYLVRLAMLAFVGIAIGHFVFTQYVPCK